MWILARQVFYWLSYLLNLVFLFIIAINQSVYIYVYISHPHNKLGTVVHTCHPSTGEVEAGGSLELDGQSA